MVCSVFAVLRQKSTLKPQAQMQLILINLTIMSCIIPEEILCKEDANSQQGSFFSKEAFDKSLRARRDKFRNVFKFKFYFINAIDSSSKVQSKA